MANQAAEASNDDSVQRVFQLGSQVAIPSLTGYLQQGVFYASTTSTQNFAAAEGASLDGGLCDIEEIDIRNISLAEKLNAIRQADKLTLYLSEGKSGGVSYKQGRGPSTAPLVRKLKVSRTQLRNASFFHVAISGAPGLVAMLPTPKEPKSTQEEEAEHTDVRIDGASWLVYNTSLRAETLPFTIDISSASEVIDWIAEKLQPGQHGITRMPGTMINVGAWPVRRPRKDKALVLQRGKRDPAMRAFWKFFDGVKGSPTAHRHRIWVDIAPYAPYEGDGVLNISTGEVIVEEVVSPDIRQLDAKAAKERVEEWIMEYKETMVQEIGEDMVVFQVVFDLTLKGAALLQGSFFHSRRLWDAIVYFGVDFLYCIPWSQVPGSWWTSDARIKVPRSTVAEFRVALTGDWFDNVLAILQRYPRKRPEPPFPTAASNLKIQNLIVEDLTVQNVEELPVGDEQSNKSTGSKTKKKKKKKKSTNLKHESLRARDWGFKSADQWWKIERINLAAWQKGLGQYQKSRLVFCILESAEICSPGCVLPFSPTRGRARREVGPNYVYTRYRWGPDDREISRLMPGKLPIYGTAADTAACSQVIPINTINLAEDSMVNTRRPEGPIEGAEQSLLVIPSECIRLNDILADWSKESGKQIKDAESYQDFLTKEQKIGANIARNKMSVNLEKYVAGHLQEYMVRGGQDTIDALESFWLGHRHKVRSIQWYEDGKQDIEEWYLVHYQQLMQEAADEVLDKAARYGKVDAFGGAEASDNLEDEEESEDSAEFTDSSEESTG
ncbi:hypothetical protein LTR42_001600 [Elasticomyces elasticus]|nr:hypothetical protein LTR42_001600 [Elasticomyces elasticus]